MAAPTPREYPAWFGRTLFKEAQVVRDGRTDIKITGRDQHHLVFVLPAGATTESCIERLEEAVGAEVKPLDRTQTAAGRIQLSGTAERYRVTMICGPHEGAIRAYVAFEWTD